MDVDYAAVRDRHSLADVARRTGIMVPDGVTKLLTHCVLPAHGHPDRSPSLRLWVDQGRYYCFGCGGRGDVIQWVRDLMGCGLAEAVRVLDSGAALTPAWPPYPFGSGRIPPGHAGHAGPDVTRTSPARVAEVLEAAWAICTTPELHREAVMYLSGERGVLVRGLEEHTGRPAAGCTPPGGLAARLARRGFAPAEIADAGLARLWPDGHMVDWFRSRLLVPVRDHCGQVIGMIGRDLLGVPGRPKYLASPPTVVCRPGDRVYDPFAGAAAAQRPAQVVLVEGVIDALAVAAAVVAAGRAGEVSVTASGGRVLSPAQVTWLARRQLPVVVARDGDTAGRAGAVQDVRSLAAAGVRAAVTMLPAGYDPASWLAETGPGGLAAFDLGAARGTRPRPFFCAHRALGARPYSQAAVSL